MTKVYEFQHQSMKQKIILRAVKGLVLILQGFAIYTLISTTEDTLRSQLKSVATIYIGFWIYANLLKVKVEISELFVPPFDIRGGLEFLAIGIVISTIAFFL